MNLTRHATHRKHFMCRLQKIHIFLFIWLHASTIEQADIGVGILLVNMVGLKIAIGREHNLIYEPTGNE
jgi:hypothetical protein